MDREIIKHWYNYNLLDIEGEIWEDVVGWKGLYQISNFLRVKTVSRKVTAGPGWRIVPSKILKQRRAWSGYLSIHLGRFGKHYELLVHILYSNASFLPNPERKRCINHIDGNKLNNSNWNLERATHGENTEHARNMGLNNCHSEAHQFSKLSNLVVLDIFNSELTSLELSKIHNVDRTTITRIKRGKIWKRVTGGVYVKKNPKILNKEIVFEIFDSILTQGQIAKKYAISQQTVSEIRCGKTWSSVTGKKYHASR